MGQSKEKTMRRVGVATILALAFFSGQPGSAAPPKGPKADVGAGRIAWFDITSTDVARSREFYGKLFDWQFNPVQGSKQALEIVAGGTPIGTLRGAEGKISLFNGVV